MLQKSCSLLLNKLVNHVAENSSDRIEALVSRTNVVQAVVVEQDLLDDKDGNGLAQLRASLHDAQAKWDDLSGEEEVDHIRAVVLDQGSDNTQGCKAQVLKWAGLRGGVEERVKEERNVSCNC